MYTISTIYPKEFFIARIVVVVTAAIVFVCVCVGRGGGELEGCFLFLLFYFCALYGWLLSWLAGNLGGWLVGCFVSFVCYYPVLLLFVFVFVFGGGCLGGGGGLFLTRSIIYTASLHLARDRHLLYFPCPLHPLLQFTCCGHPMFSMAA